jgi:YD repeat-containing protein
LLNAVVGASLSLWFISASFGGTVNYVYDNLNRVKQVRYADGTIIDYTYDELGNRLEEKVTAPTSTQTDGTLRTGVHLRKKVDSKPQ